MRASLLASAIASTLWCRRWAAAAIQGWRPWRCHVAGLSSTTRAAWTKRVRRYAQVLVAAFGNPAQDGAIAGGDLLGDETKPGTEVAALGEGVTGSDGGNRDAGDDGADAWHRHQALTGRVVLSKQLDLKGNTVDALIQPPPVADEVLKEVEQAGSEQVGARGENIRQCSSQAMQALSDGDAAVEEEGADLVGDRRALTDETGADTV